MKKKNNIVLSRPYYVGQCICPSLHRSARNAKLIGIFLSFFFLPNMIQKNASTDCTSQAINSAFLSHERKAFLMVKVLGRFHLCWTVYPSNHVTRNAKLFSAFLDLHDGKKNTHNSNRMDLRQAMVHPDVY